MTQIKAFSSILGKKPSDTRAGRLQEFCYRCLCLGIIFLCILGILTREVNAQDAILLGGPSNAPTPRPLNPELPRGPQRQVLSSSLEEIVIEYLTTPLAQPQLIKRCSFIAPICTLSLASQTNAEQLTRGALALLERAYEQAVFGAGFIGFSASLQAQLIWDLSAAGDLETRGFTKTGPGFDRGLFLCRFGDLTIETATLCINESLLHLLSPGTQVQLRHGFGLYATESMTPHSRLLRQDAYLAQNASESGILASTTSQIQSAGLVRNPGAGTAALLAEFFGRKLAAGQPLEAVYIAHLMAVSRSHAEEYIAEPDVFDLYRNSISPESSPIARFYGAFAAERTFATQLRPATKPRWQLNAKELPHNIILSRGLGSYGSTQLELDVSTLPAGSSVGVRLYCEGPVSYQFIVLRLNKDKKELSRFVFPFREGVHRFSQKIEFSQATQYLRLVGTVLGGIGSAYPFDPDQGPFRRRHCGIYLTP